MNSLFEILGTMTAIKTIVLGGSMPAATDMKTGEISYDVPSAIKLDVAMTKMHEEFYGFDFGTGIYCSDAKFLGPEIIQERIIQLLAAAFLKRFNPPIGLYDQGMIFSPELVLIEIDIVKYIINSFIENIEDNDIDLVIEIINNVGPGGTFLTEKHTLDNFKKLFRSEILGEIVDMKNDKKLKSMFDLSNEKYKKIMENIKPFKLPADKEKEIDRIVERAYKDIIG